MSSLVASLEELVCSGDVEAVAEKLTHLDEGGKNEVPQALITAARNGHDKLVALMLDSGASVDHLDGHGLSGKK